MAAAVPTPSTGSPVSPVSQRPSLRPTARVAAKAATSTLNVTLPDRVGSLIRSYNTQLESQLTQANEAAHVPASEHLTQAFYTTGIDRVLVTTMALHIPTNADARNYIAGVANGAHVTGGMRLANVGAHGGMLACGHASLDAEPGGGLCVWVDGRGTGVVVAYGQSIDTALDETKEIRKAAER